MVMHIFFFDFFFIRFSFTKLFFFASLYFWYLKNTKKKELKNTKSSHKTRTTDCCFDEDASAAGAPEEHYKQNENSLRTTIYQILKSSRFGYENLRRNGKTSDRATRLYAFKLYQKVKLNRPPFLLDRRSKAK